MQNAKTEQSYLKWLERHGYLEATQHLSVKQLKHAYAYWLEKNELPGGYLVSALRRYLTYAVDTGDTSFGGDAFVNQIAANFDTVEISPTGVRAKRDLDEGQWFTLREALRKSQTAEDRVLYVFMLQPYGLKDCLTMSVSDLKDEVDVRLVPWLKEVAAHRTLAWFLCRTSEKPFICAQSRLRRRLQHWSRVFGYKNVDLRTLHKASKVAHSAA